MRHVGRHALACQRLVHVVAERLNLREEHTTVANRIAVNIVKISVAVCLVVVVKAVCAEQSYYGLVLNLLLRYIRKVDSGGVALVFHVKAELVFLDRGGKIIDILHHQVPVALPRVVAGVLKRLDEECLADILHV